MSPEGWALALLLHALAAFLLWWMSHNRPPIPVTEDVVEVSFEAPKPPPPPAPTPAPTPATTPPIEGIRPPAELTSENPTQVRPTAENPSNQNIPLSPPQSLEKAIPTPEPEPAPPSSQAFEPPKPAPTPTPTPPQQQQAAAEQAIDKAFEKAMPPLPKPEPPKPEPPKPAPTKPQQQAAIAVPPANPNPRPPPPPQPRPTPPQIAPSPLSRIPQQQRPSAVARGRDAPQSSPFVNPADTYNKARAADNYLWEIVRRLQGYQYHANEAVSGSVTVVSITVARDGRLLNVAVLSSSGYPEMDRGVVAGVRQGSPYTPLPDSIQGASATFRLPLVSSRAR
jgi:TonB family protein